MSVLASISAVLSGLSALGPSEPIDVMEGKFGAVRSLPAFGTIGLYSVIVFAGITFAISLAAAKRPRLLAAARSAALATCALVVFDLLLLAYAFVTHDFRIRYVARYSDRSMPTAYLLTALWGGQDGSLLWWLFLLSANTAACVGWMRNKYRELQPYVIATLMAIMAFFVVIMAFSANPFSESLAGARVDGEGLNPLLQNFYMIIHPPSLYTGFVACSVPFAFGVAALASGRLDEEWITVVRKPMMFAWVFLSIGNVLGMLWAYEELGWGGYWAWDPVENAAFMPWLTASAFVHSTMIQERRRMLKVWNVVLIGQTFFMTIWGTFLTRSGMIASVHAFAQSSIGIYFTYFMVTIACVVAALVTFRLPELKNLDVDAAATRVYRNAVGPVILRTLVAALVTILVIRYATPKMTWLALVALLVVQGLIGYGLGRMRRAFNGFPWGDFTTSIAVGFILPFTLPGCAVYWLTASAKKEIAPTPDARARQVATAAEIDSVFSREAAFVANNWVLVAMQAFICITTAFPLISEAVTGEKVTVGPAFYNRWMVPLGLILFALMGIGPLLGWRKTSNAALRKAFRIPLGAIAAAVLLHIAIGRKIGFPAMVDSDPIYPGALGTILAKIVGVVPVVATALAAFNAAVILQEYGRGIAARMRIQREAFGYALIRLVAKSKRRYGGYIVHAGIIVMFLGFTGSAYKVDQEVAMRPGEVVQFQGYTFTYLKPRRDDTDPTKMMIFTDVHVKKGNRDLGVLSPARFIYRRQQMPTSEVAIKWGPRDDIYIAPGSINPETKLATLHIYVNPLTSWIWLGAMILIFGAAVATWPDPELEEVGVGAYLRTAGAVASSLVLGILLAITPARAHAAQPSGGGGSSLHAGDVQMKTPEERQLFTNLLCMCGTCDRLPLSACACGWADEMRQKLKARLAGGESIASITDSYVKEHGTASLNVPPSRGFLRSIWLVPTALIAVGGVSAVLLVRSWTRKSSQSEDKDGKGASGNNKNKAPRDDYDAKLDAELDELDH